MTGMPPPALIPKQNGPNIRSPENFLVHLRATIYEAFPSHENSRVVASENFTCVLLLTQMLDAFLISFSFNDLWNAQPERINLVQACLETTEIILNRVDGILFGHKDVNGSKELPKKLFNALFTVCHTLDLYSDTDIAPREGISMPSSLREIARRTVILTLRCMGGSHPTSVDEPLWKTLRSVMEELLSLSRDVIHPNIPLTFPLAVSLFRKPHLQPINPHAPHPSQERVMMVFSSEADISRFLSLIVDVTVNSLHPHVLCSWFLYDLQQKVDENVQAVFDYCLSSFSVSRAKALAHILSAVSLTRFEDTSRFSPLTALPFRLLRQRLLPGPSTGWEPVDTYFLGATRFPSLSKAEIVEILNLVREAEKVGVAIQHQTVAVAYIRACLSQMSPPRLLSLLDAIVEADLQGAEWTLLSGDLQTRIAEVETPIVVDTRIQPWREVFRKFVEKTAFPQHILDWMEDDDDQRYVQHSLDEVVSIYRTCDPPASNEARTSVLSAVMSLCDLLRGKSPLKWSTVQFCVVLATWLLQGPDVPVDTRRKVFMMVTGMLKLHVMNDDRDETLHPMARFFSRNLLDTNASVRLNVGKAICAMLALFGERNVNVWDRADDCFAMLYHIMDTGKLTVKETMILVVGGMAKDTSLHSDLVGQALCFLVAQMGRPNPVLRGSVCMQILEAAKSHNKVSAYPLLLPYMDRIAPFLVQRMCIQPAMLSETCRLMGLGVSDFLRTTMPKTLPVLFANEEHAVLEMLAKNLAQKPASLFLHNAHEILAHVFRKDRGGTEHAIEFITSFVSQSSSGKTRGVDIQSLVKSCVVPLLAELVTSLGDRRPQVTEEALAALRKVEKILTGSGHSDLGAFLKNYMLGLMSHINDMLQDVQGKKSVDVKKKILRSLGVLMFHTGSATASVAPQIMATFQTMVSVPELCEETLFSWHQFLTMLSAEEIAPHVGLTSAAFISSWPVLTSTAQSLVKKALQHLIMDKGSELATMNSLADLVDFSQIPELRDVHQQLLGLQGELTPKERLGLTLERAVTNNPAMVLQSLYELKQFMLVDHPEIIRDLVSGDIFDPIVGQILMTLLTAAGRDVEEGDPLRTLAFECLSILGAVDPDRCELRVKESSMIVYQNFEDEEESIAFALHLITDLLVEAFRSASDMRYQSHLAFTIQELLRFCQFTPALVTRQSAPQRVRKRWNTLPKHVLETVTPLLEARYNIVHPSSPPVEGLVYPERSTYREWIQLWTLYLISQVSGETAQKIFGVFPSVIRNKDVAVAHRLLPHLVLNVLLSGSGDSSTQIRLELLAVLEDQVNPMSTSSSDKRMLSAQAVFMLLDHLNRWLRKIRQDIANVKEKSNRHIHRVAEQLTRVDSIISNINQDLLAKAALQCKAYALSLMNFESRIVTLRTQNPDHHDLPAYYERLHEIYAALDEPDGMEGISTMILSPTLEHQIRHHESSGHWTSAQSCWEVRLQQSPDNVDYHLGLLRCLRNLGHYDTLRTHVRGVLTRNPDWQPTLAGFHIESAWMVGAWDDVQSIIDSSDVTKSQMVIGRLLLAMRSQESTAISQALTNARLVLGGPIAAAGPSNYRRSYEAMLDLHLTHELETIYITISTLPQRTSRLNPALENLSQVLTARLNTTLPTFRAREPILSMRRTAFALFDSPNSRIKEEIGKSWLASAKIARKAGQWQTAYSAMLQSEQSKTKYAFIESAKLVKAMGDPLHALQQLENSMHLHRLLEDQPDNVLDLTNDDDEGELQKTKSKVRLVRARWMNESERFDARTVLKTFKKATDLIPHRESGQYYLGQFQDECYKNLPPTERLTRGLKMNLSTIKAYAEAINLGTKYIYQTVPRLLTLWLDLGEENKIPGGNTTFQQINLAVAEAIKNSPIYKWFTAFPQIVSRIGHTNPEVYKLLARIIMKVIVSYPNQALWLFAAVIKSKKPARSQRGVDILNRIRNNPGSSKVPKLIDQSIEMTNELLELCNLNVDAILDKRKLTITRDFPRLAKMGKSEMIIPLQESLTASLPPVSSSESGHQPFPSDAPTFAGFAEEIEIMHSLAKPRKITIYGSDGQTYMFLGKPKDDLRKDARLMDFNAIINKLLKANSESRRRQLHIRTYGVVTLNEECGFIQWVRHTRPVRPILLKLYSNKQISPWSNEMAEVFARIKSISNEEPNKAAELFSKKVLSRIPPVFHEWFIETFPEPTAWLASRLTYARTAAVMSMVGFILGLGDRHCENILLDENTGDLIHVDFNCLFEKGKTLETPERVPFRLTQNLVDALGVTGVEGVFRTACEVTMQLLRDNKDSLMSVLDAFVHDPLVEWEEEKLRQESAERRNPQRKGVKDLSTLAKTALKGIDKKLRGLYRPGPERHAFEKEVSTSNLVQLLIQEATDMTNLGRMYPGWAPWH